MFGLFPDLLPCWSTGLQPLEMYIIFLYTLIHFNLQIFLVKSVAELLRYILPFQNTPTLLDKMAIVCKQKAIVLYHKWCRNFSFHILLDYLVSTLGKLWIQFFLTSNTVYYVNTYVLTTYLLWINCVEIERCLDNLC